MKDDNMGIIIILGIIAVALLGGVNNTENNILGPTNPKTTNEEKQKAIQVKLKETQVKVDELKKQIELEKARKTESPYKDLVNILHVNRTTNANQEYIAIQTRNNKTPINVTGWKIKSLNTGVSTVIPKATYLYFAGTINSEDDIYLNSYETLYLVTGISPNGASFKINKCSGYLSQFQKFIPYINTRCPLPKNEDLSGIPKSPVNDDCLTYIESFPSCRIQTKTLPLNYTYECTNFIYNKINYPSCVSVHKGDKDFYGREWRVYLKRSDTLWKQRRESIVLYDLDGKIVDTITY